MNEAVKRIRMFFVIDKTRAKTRDEILAKTGAMLLISNIYINESCNVDMKFQQVLQLMLSSNSS